MAFDIKTGAEEAQKKFDEKQLKIPGPDEVTKPSQEVSEKICEAPVFFQTNS